MEEGGRERARFSKDRASPGVRRWLAAFLPQALRAQARADSRLSTEFEPLDVGPPHERRREHEAAFGSARDGVAVIAPDWRIRYMNASMLEILRLIGHAARVETLWDALPGWERSDAADALRQAMAAAAPVCFRVDGERGRGRVWEVETEPLDTGELRLRVRNVTSLARAEEAERARAPQGSLAEADREARLDAIVSGAPVGIVLLDAETLLVREANAFYHQFLEGPFRIPTFQFAGDPTRHQEEKVLVRLRKATVIGCVIHETDRAESLSIDRQTCAKIRFELEEEAGRAIFPVRFAHMLNCDRLVHLQGLTADVAQRQQGAFLSDRPIRSNGGQFQLVPFDGHEGGHGELEAPASKIE